MSEEFKAKRYACTRWPFLRVGGGVKFNAGFFTATTPEQVEAIEKNEAFGKSIHPILWEPKAVPTKPGKIEALIESEIVEQLAATKPAVKRGARGTR